MDPTEHPASQWIPPSTPSIPPEKLASGSRRVSRQSSPPVDPAEYPAEYPRVAHQWIPPSIPLSILAGGSCQVSGQHRAGAARQHSPVDPASIPPEQLASLVLLNVPPGAQLGLHFMFVPSCFECTLRLGKGDAFVLLWVVKKQLRLIPRRVSFWKGWLLLTEPMFEFSRSARR